MKNLSYDIMFRTNKFSISTLNYMIDNLNLPLKDGMVTGAATIKGYIGKIASKIEGSVSIENGYIHKWLNHINSNLIFNKKTIQINQSSADILNNRVTFKGFLSLNKGKIVILNAKAPKFVLNLNNLKSKKENSYEINIPQIYMNADINIDNLVLKRTKNSKTMQHVYIKLNNEPKRSMLHIASQGTKLYIDKIADKIKVFIEDYNIFSYLTGCNKNSNLFNLQAELKSKNANSIKLANLKGNIDLLIRNGEFKNVSNDLKLLSATNIIEIVIGKTKIKKNLPYKKIVGNFYLEKSIIKTRKNTIVMLYGDNLNIFMQGYYNFAKHYVDIYATFTTLRTLNRLISHIPIVGWILGGKQKSFTGVNFHIKGDVNKTLNVKAIPLKGLGKGVLDIIKRTLTLPFNTFGVGK